MTARVLFCVPVLVWLHVWLRVDGIAGMRRHSVSCSMYVAGACHSPVLVAAASPVLAASGGSFANVGCGGRTPQWPPSPLACRALRRAHTLAAAPPQDPSRVYLIFRVMWARYWCKLNTISTMPGTLLPLCKLFEDLIQQYIPRAVFHLSCLGVSPLRIAFPWIRYAFVGYLEVDQVRGVWRASLLGVGTRADGWLALQLCATCTGVFVVGPYLRVRGVGTARGACSVHLRVSVQGAACCQDRRRCRVRARGARTFMPAVVHVLRCRQGLVCPSSPRSALVLCRAEPCSRRRSNSGLCLCSSTFCLLSRQRSCVCGPRCGETLVDVFMNSSTSH